MQSITRTAFKLVPNDSDKFCFRKFPKFPIALATTLPEHQKPEKNKHDQRNQRNQNQKKILRTMWDVYRVVVLRNFGLLVFCFFGCLLLFFVCVLVVWVFCFSCLFLFLCFFVFDFLGCGFTGFATYPASLNIVVYIRILINPKDAGRT